MMSHKIVTRQPNQRIMIILVDIAVITNSCISVKPPSKPARLFLHLLLLVMRMPYTFEVFVNSVDYIYLSPSCQYCPFCQ